MDGDFSCQEFVPCHRANPLPPHPESQGSMPHWVAPSPAILDLSLLPLRDPINVCKADPTRLRSNPLSPLKKVRQRSHSLGPPAGEIEATSALKFATVQYLL